MARRRRRLIEGLPVEIGKEGRLYLGRDRYLAGVLEWRNPAGLHVTLWLPPTRLELDFEDEDAGLREVVRRFETWMASDLGLVTRQALEGDIPDRDRLPALLMKVLRASQHWRTAYSLRGALRRLGLATHQDDVERVLWAEVRQCRVVARVEGRHVPRFRLRGVEPTTTTAGG